MFLAAIGAATVGVVGAAPTQTPVPTTFSVTRLQAEEVGAVVGFLRAYNRRDLKGALSFFSTRPRDQRNLLVGDCNYRRHKTEVFYFRSGVKHWLKQRFADHDRLTLGRVYDANPRQPIGVVLIEYVRRTSDTLRKLGFAHGIVPQSATKLPFAFVRGQPKFPFFGLASTHAPMPNPECALVPATG